MTAVQNIEDDRSAGGFDLEQHVQGVEREYIMEALRRSNGVKKNAAELLGLSFRQFKYLLKKYNIQYGSRTAPAVCEPSAAAGRHRPLGVTGAPPDPIRARQPRLRSSPPGAPVQVLSQFVIYLR